MIVKAGQIATLRDGREVFVTDAADQDQKEYFAVHPTNEEAFEYFDGPVETIFVGKLFDSRIRGWSKDNSQITVVSDMSEVVSVR